MRSRINLLLRQEGMFAMKGTSIFVLCLALTLTAAVTLSAQQAQLNPGKTASLKSSITGTVLAVSPTNIAVQIKTGLKTFTVNPKTRVNTRGQKGTITDIKVNDPVTVHFTTDSDKATALNIRIHNPSFTGKITAIEDNTFTITGKEGTAKVLVVGKTKIASHSYKATIADLRVGFTASAEGPVSAGQVVAETVNFQPAIANGMVCAADANTIIVKTLQKLTIPLAPSEATVVRIHPESGPTTHGKFADIKVGAHVNAGFIPVRDGTSKLLWIEVITGS